VRTSGDSEEYLQQHVVVVDEEHQRRVDVLCVWGMFGVVGGVRWVVGGSIRLNTQASYRRRFNRDLIEIQ
jgi:hypothetical protein